MDELIRQLELVKNLTPSERAVLPLLCHGLTLKDIAEQLGVSVSTIRFHAGHIYEKLGMAKMQQTARRVAFDRVCQALSSV
jgi:DNA-binding NarL/FixJ family response regulator